LASAQFGAEELVQGLFLALQTEPQRLRGFQITDHGDQFRLFPEEDLSHAHLMKRGLFALRIPALQNVAF
jgi:hypothetical protein